MFEKLYFVAMVLASTAVAQMKRDHQAPTPLSFETVSIRQNVAGGHTVTFGPTPYGFRMVNMPLGRVITTA